MKNLTQDQFRRLSEVDQERYVARLQDELESLAAKENKANYWSDISMEDVDAIDNLRGIGQSFSHAVDTSPVPLDKRCAAISKTKIEEAILWATQGVILAGDDRARAEEKKPIWQNPPPKKQIVDKEDPEFDARRHTRSTGPAA